MRFGNILALCAITLLTGCATGGARYADVNVGAPKLAPDLSEPEIQIEALEAAAEEE